MDLSKKISVCFITLGCAKNEADSAQMKQKLLFEGYHITDNPDIAHIVIINTCSFIQAAVEESIDTILLLCNNNSAKQSRTRFIVCGCLPSRYGNGLYTELPEVDYFLTCKQENDIVRIVDQVVGRKDKNNSSSINNCIANKQSNNQIVNKTNRSNNDAITSNTTSTNERKIQQVIRNNSAVIEDGTNKDKAAKEHSTGQVSGQISSIVSTAGPYSSYIKISDGCNRFCSFCSIPYIRGRYHSCSYDEISHSVEQAISAGMQEIVLVAQDTGIWGYDFNPKLDLAWLIDALATRYKDTWFRVLYIQPENISERLLSVISQHSNIMNYLDIPIQHVVPKLLRTMNRQGSGEEFAKLINNIRKVMPDVTLRTTLITGFPGETEEDFEELCSFVEKGYFDYVSAFAYSREEGTKAFSLPNQLPENIKQKRLQHLLDLSFDTCTNKLKEQIGKTLSVLVEGYDEEGRLYGRFSGQAPEVDGLCILDKGTLGHITSMKVSDTMLYDLEGVASNE